MEPFMSFSSVKNTYYIAKKMFLRIQYSLDLFQKISSISRIYIFKLLYTFTKHFEYWFDLALFCNNQSALKRVRNHVCHANSKHVEI
jgi:hypothetical protein